ncbi:hypothetical protein YC2023_020294 [Brassica napus]
MTTRRKRRRGGREQGKRKPTHGGSMRDVEHIAYLKSSKDLVEHVVCGDYRMEHGGCGD